MFFSKYRWISVVALALIVSCTNTPDKDFRARAENLRRRTMPAGSTASEQTPVMHSGTVAQTEWQVSSPLSELAFRALLSQQLEPEFSKVASDDLRIVYSRLADGDSERLEVMTIKQDGNLRQYNVRFSMMPD
ncbi:MAG: hypothetical protein WA738_20990 [Candidatus Angelobacter sp.]